MNCHFTFLAVELKAETASVAKHEIERVLRYIAVLLLFLAPSPRVAKAEAAGH